MGLIPPMVNPEHSMAGDMRGLPDGIDEQGTPDGR
jgi:hypothetical protein